ncbi:uncharacterized protein LOC117167660 isoform X2 [Belonocnema kinseyi]|uniref:uncharacterized protein LOC117167660 isoform X2 n=1 Tax=Belonocnema kinseyi TaxID=2817044 RepID=UPI00143D2297|nr:uncharacterized protein LOC117167660 isoform X2 [Belonocnema kinseyi]
MQNIGSNADITETTNSTIFPSSKCQSLDDLSISKEQLYELKHTISELEKTILVKDSQMEYMQRNNKRLSEELKKQHRINRNLDDERFFYQKEKDHFNEEMQNHREKYLGGSSKYHRLEFERIKALLEEENKKLKDELFEKKQTTYNLCVKFLKMKHERDSFREKLDNLTKEHLQVMAEMMEKLDEAREELNIIVSIKFQDPLPISKAKYLQIVKRNCRLVHENATLKLQVQHLIQIVEKFRNESQKLKTVDIDVKSIEKLIERHRRSRRPLDSEMTLRLPSRDKIETRKSSDMEACRAVDQSGDAKLISKLRAKNCNTFMKMEMDTLSKSNNKLFVVPETSCTQSSPALPTSTIQQYHFVLESGNVFEKNVELKNMATNT